MFWSLPMHRSSTTRPLAPRQPSLSTSEEPINEAPPVTKTGRSCQFISASSPRESGSFLDCRQPMACPLRSYCLRTTCHGTGRSTGGSLRALISRGPNQILDLGLCPGHTNLRLKGQKLPTKAICPRSAIDDESSPARTRRAAMPSLASSLSPSEDLGQFKV